LFFLLTHKLEKEKGFAKQIYTQYKDTTIISQPFLLFFV